MLHTSRTTSRLALAVAVGLLAFPALAGCGSDDNPAAGAGDESSSSGSSVGAADGSGDGGSAGDSATDGSGGSDDSGSGDAADPNGDADGADGSGDDADGGSSTPAPGSAEDPSSPFVVAAAAVGTRSRDQVITLHAMGFSTTHDNGVPHEALPAQGEEIAAALNEQVKAATQLTPPKGSPAARLVASLHAYDRLAADLAGWNPDGAPLPPSWFTRIAATDKAWTQAMKDLSELSDNDLLADMPELLMPASA
jgi:hypothetical protein